MSFAKSEIMTVVLDASAAVRAVLNRETETAILDILDNASTVITTDLFIAEVTSGLWKYVTAGRISVDEAAGSLDEALDFVNTFHEIAGLAHEVLREASLRRHPVYDLYYVVLARREGAAILTFDKRLKELCGEMGIPLAGA